MQNELAALVKEQYETYPYPHYPIWGRVRPESSLHASYEAGMAVARGARASSAGKSILLLGCGTLEPAALAGMHRDAQLTAVDLSQSTLRRARLRCFLHQKHNVKFVAGDLIEFAGAHNAQFDYVHCYGVLHHIIDPAQGFTAVARTLKPDGIARVMVYSRSHRRRQSLLIDSIKALKLASHTSANIKLIRAFLKALPDDHPFKALALLNTDLKSDQGLVDALLHACEHSFTLDALLALVKQAGLQITAFDLNASMLNLVAQIKPASPALTDKIKQLEAFGQWPGSFTFWVTKKKPTNVTKSSSTTSLFINPHFRWRGQSSFYSVVLRKKLIFTPAQRGLLDQLSASGQPHFEADTAALGELKAARVILEAGGQGRS